MSGVPAPGQVSLHLDCYTLLHLCPGMYLPTATGSLNSVDTVLTVSLLKYHYTLKTVICKKKKKKKKKSCGGRYKDSDAICHNKDPFMLLWPSTMANDLHLCIIHCTYNLLHYYQTDMSLVHPLTFTCLAASLPVLLSSAVRGDITVTEVLLGSEVSCV